MDSQSKNRLSPLSSQGISLLIDVVGQYPVVTDRRSDARIVAVKNEAWENIAVTFNATGVGGHPRTSKQLRRIWDRIKSKAKEEHDKVKPELKKTGGGPPPTPYPDETSKVLDLVRGELYDTTNPFDSNNARPTSSTYSMRESAGVPTIEVEDMGLEVISYDDPPARNSTSSTQGINGNLGTLENCASDRSPNHSYDNPPPAKKLRRSFKFDRKEKENWKPLRMSAEQYREAFDIEKKILQNRLEESQLRKDTEKCKNEVEKEILALRKDTEKCKNEVEKEILALRKYTEECNSEVEREICAIRKEKVMLEKEILHIKKQRELLNLENDKASLQY